MCASRVARLAFINNNNYRRHLCVLTSSAAAFSILPLVSQMVTPHDEYDDDDPELL
jgi:hypothetical protein